MKPEELRIGNLLENDGGRVRIEAIQNNGKLKIYDFYNETSHKHLFDLDQFRGIPLTEEWLMKFGFNKQEDGDDVDDVHWYEITTNGITLVQGDKKGYIDVFLLYHEEGVRVRYVHQLQNLFFALTGEELTVK